MSFWTSLLGGGKKTDGGLPIGGSAAASRGERQQASSEGNNRREHNTNVPAANNNNAPPILPPPPTTISYVPNNNSNNNTNNNQLPLGKPPTSGPPLHPTYVSPGNQRTVTAATGGAPVIPGHSPLRVPLSPLTTLSPSSTHLPGPPLGIHVFNPASVSKSSHVESNNTSAELVMSSDPADDNPSAMLAEELASPIEESPIDAAYQPLPPPLPDNFQNDDLIIPNQDTYEDPTLTFNQETSTAAAVDSILTPRQALDDDENMLNSAYKGDESKYPSSPDPVLSPVRSFQPDSMQTPSSSSTLTTSLVRHNPVAPRSASNAMTKDGSILSTDLVLVHQQETQLALFTPKSNSRFVFASDEKSVPTELKKVGEVTMKRRHQFQTRVHELECHLASLTAKLALESMDRETAFADILPGHVYQPLEVVAERLLVERDLARRPQLIATTTTKSPDKATTTSTSDDVDEPAKECGKPALMDLELRLSNLDSQMTKHIHQTMFDAKREKLEALQDQLLHEIFPELHLEASKADKREGSMNRRWEGLVGILARRYVKESSSRKASLAVVEEELRGVLHQQEAEDIVVLSTLQELRAKLEQERAERLAEDKRILELIAERAVTLQRLLLETLGDPILE